MMTCRDGGSRVDGEPYGPGDVSKLLATPTPKANP